MEATKTEASEAGIHEELIKFAQQHPIIEAVYKGRDPENFSGFSTVYYLLAPGRYDEKLEDKITGLDKHLSCLFPDTHIDIMRLPISPERAHEQGFLEKCIWKKASQPSTA